jgi:hypothetical protein
MREETLRAVLMVQAVEEIDRAGVVLPSGDRAQATREAVRALGAGVDEASLAADDRLLARALGERAERLLPPLVQRYPIVDEALGRTRTPAGLLLVLLVVAFASGVALSALDGSRRINILAFPFLGLIAWNLATYAVLAVGWIRGRLGKPAASSGAARGWAARLFARRIEPLLRRTRRVHVVLGEVLGVYAALCAQFGGAFISQHARRWLHLAAAFVAVGLIVGLYVRGTVLRYEAGWESTFLGPAQVQAILGVVFGPVAGWSGVALPASVAEVEQLRWTPGGGGGSAAPWIHLIALSLVQFVVLPRLLLAGLATFGLWRLGRSTALPDELRRYAADVLRGGGVVRGTGVASVTPYACEPSAAALAGLARWLHGACGTSQVERRTSLRYGEEDMAAAAFAIGAHRVADLHVVVMSLAATPEAENHGVVIAAARDAAHRARPPAGVRIVVDESPYAARLAGDATLASRLEERRRLWRNFVAGYGLDADLLPLEAIG